jgi:hypothetical protein
LRRDVDAPHSQLRDSAGLGAWSTPHRLPGIGTHLLSRALFLLSGGQALTLTSMESIRGEHGLTSGSQNQGLTPLKV